MSFFTHIQPILPHHLISRLVGWATHSEWPFLKRTLIERISSHYQITLEDYTTQNIAEFASFNDFFTRELKAGARKIDQDANSIASPVDGKVSQAGYCDDDRILQAKGRHYSASALLGSDATADAMRNGAFSTLYLAPNNYHRIHMPVTGQLHTMRYVPGRLFSVNEDSVANIDKVFARNERVIFEFDTDFGPMALIMVGALNVGSIETIHQGVIAPNGLRKVQEWRYETPHILEKGQELGRFNMGSTVILMFSENSAVWQENLTPGRAIRMGEALGQVSTTSG